MLKRIEVKDWDKNHWRKGDRIEGNTYEDCIIKLSEKYGIDLMKLAVKQSIDLMGRDLEDSIREFKRLFKKKV